MNKRGFCHAKNANRDPSPEMRAVFVWSSAFSPVALNRANAELETAAADARGKI
jgi:hypothetical protein